MNATFMNRAIASKTRWFEYEGDVAIVVRMGQRSENRSSRALGVELSVGIFTNL